MPETLPYVTTAGGLPYGSRILMINGVAYIADNFNITRPTQQLSRKSQIGAPNGFRLLADRKTATASLQLEVDSTAIPGRGLEFDGEAADEVAKWVIIEVSPAEVSDGLKTVAISCWEKV